MIQHGPPSQVKSYFLRAAMAVNPRTRQGKSGQGFYVLDASGRPLAHTNRRGTAVIRSFARSGLRKVRAGTVGYMTSRQAMSIAPPALYPEGTASVDPNVHVVRVYTRIRPVPAAAGPSNRNVG